MNTARNRAKKISNWLETHWVTPSYSGWLLSGLSIFFFFAGTNTLAGWLYVISGISFALLGLAAILPGRTLQGIRIRRSPVYPVSVGDQLTIELILENASRQAKTLIQVQDHLPPLLGGPITTAIEVIPPQSTHAWTYYQPTQRRGIYRWQGVQLRTAAPLGLFWCRRSRTAKATAIVYPTVLPLTQCPLVDEMGRDQSLQLSSDRRAQAATEGLTRSLRPYRLGDPTRLIHWRTSARYGELRVRELEIFTGGQEFIICLDSAMPWRDASDHATTPPETFEQAVIAAASLYFYAHRRSLNVKLWTAGTGLIQGNSIVLEALAATQAGEEVRAEHLPTVPLLWLTQNPLSLGTLPSGSRWVLWTGAQPTIDPQLESDTVPLNRAPGLVISSEKSLQLQLQSLPSKQF